MKATDIPAVQAVAKTGTPVERMAIAMTLLAESARVARKFLEQGRTELAAKQLDDLLAEWDALVELLKSNAGKANG